MANPFRIAGGGTAATTTTRSVTVATATAVGDTVIAIVNSNNIAGTISGLSDSAGNVYTLDASYLSASPLTYLYRAQGATGGPGGGPTAALSASTGTVTASIPSGTNCTVAFMVVDVAGWGLLDLLSPIANGTSTTPSVSATPTANSEMALSCFVTGNAGGVPTLNSPFTSVGAPSSSGAYSAAAYNQLSASSSGVAQTSTATIVSAAWRAAMYILAAPVLLPQQEHMRQPGVGANPELRSASAQSVFAR